MLDIYSIIQKLAADNGYVYSEDLSDNNIARIVLTKGNEQTFVIVPYIENGVIRIACSVFNLDADIGEEMMAKILNMLNVQNCGCHFLLLPDKEQENQFEMLVATDVLITSKSHFSNALTNALYLLEDTKKYYVDILKEVLETLDTECMTK